MLIVIVGPSSVSLTPDWTEEALSHCDHAHSPGILLPLCGISEVPLLVRRRRTGDSPSVLFEAIVRYQRVGLSPATVASSGWI